MIDGPCASSECLKEWIRDNGRKRDRVRGELGSDPSAGATSSLGKSTAQHSTAQDNSPPKRPLHVRRYCAIQLDYAVYYAVILDERHLIVRHGPTRVDEVK